VNAAVVVDVGNTRVKWGRCGADRVEEVASLPPEPDAWARQMESWKMPAGAAWVLSGVHPQRRDALAEWLRQRNLAVTVITHPRDLPLTVRLEHPERAGIDRLLNAVAVNSRRAPGVPAIIIDAGSAVTVDWLDDTGAFCGGAILPGLRLMAKALHDYTALLPEINITRPPQALPGTTTTGAMEVGVFFSVVGAIQQFIKYFPTVEAHEPRPELFLTGGDGPLLQPAVVGWVGQKPILWPEMTLEGVRLSAAALP
jgi:type III pantothenate kinase